MSTDFDCYELTTNQVSGKGGGGGFKRNGGWVDEGTRTPGGWGGERDAGDNAGECAWPVRLNCTTRACSQPAPSWPCYHRRRDLEEDVKRLHDVR